MSPLPSGGIERPDFIAPTEPPHTYLGISECLMPGVDTLASSRAAVGAALASLCAHILECLLKAYISKATGSNAEIISHNLNELWDLAVSKGLPAPAKPPAWADSLNHLHGPPYYLRYSTGVHGLITPAAQPMVSELKTLLEVVQKQRE